MHDNNPITQEAKAKGSQVQSQSGLCSEFRLAWSTYQDLVSNTMTKESKCEIYFHISPFPALAQKAKIRAQLHPHHVLFSPAPTGHTHFTMLHTCN